MFGQEWQTIGVRVLLIAGSLVLWFLTQKMIGARKLEGNAIYDHLHVLTARGNAWLHQNPRYANAFLAASSLGVVFRPWSRLQSRSGASSVGRSRAA